MYLFSTNIMDADGLTGASTVWDLRLAIQERFGIHPDDYYFARPEVGDSSKTLDQYGVGKETTLQIVFCMHKSYRYHGSDGRRDSSVSRLARPRKPFRLSAVRRVLRPAPHCPVRGGALCLHRVFRTARSQPLPDVPRSRDGPAQLYDGTGPEVDDVRVVVNVRRVYIFPLRPQRKP